MTDLGPTRDAAAVSRLTAWPMATGPPGAVTDLYGTWAAAHADAVPDESSS